MNINIIHNDTEHRIALQAIARFFDREEEVDPSSPEGEEFLLLSMMIEAYEKVHFPIAMPDPIDAIKFRMEQGGMKPADLVPHIGGVNRVYEVLKKRRALSLPMIRGLSTLGIPEKVLIQPYDLEPPPTPRKAAVQAMDMSALRKAGRVKKVKFVAAKKTAKKVATKGGNIRRKPAQPSEQPPRQEVMAARKTVSA